MRAAPDTRRLRRRLWSLALLLALLVGLAIAWSGSPLREWLDAERIVAALRRFGDAFGPLAAIAGFAFACTIAIPLTFLTIVALVAFGPAAGFVYALTGAAIGAAVSHRIGMLLGREAIERLAGPRVNELSRRLGRRGLYAVLAVRLVPVAPFAIVNMVAGASQISLRDMIVGTVVGMTPGTLAMMLFIDQILAAIREPGPTTALLVVLTLALIAGGAWAARRWLRDAAD